ncbi:hypothetical protein [Halospeciosus flavus]|uniref:hypothetical protein n=1 Tax=Halospeciosus flavus TaxID=3032283 RepID=UPI0036182B94
MADDGQFEYWSLERRFAVGTSDPTPLDAENSLQLGEGFRHFVVRTTADSPPFPLVHPAPASRTVYNWGREFPLHRPAIRPRVPSCPVCERKTLYIWGGCVAVRRHLLVAATQNGNCAFRASSSAGSQARPTA